MQIFIEAIDLNIWEVIKISPYIPTMIVGNATIEKSRKQWDEKERRRIQYNLKAKNIITSALGMNEYFRVSNCKDAKEMWDTLQVTHEGTIDVKRSRINTLTHEYELFRLNQNETIQDMQKKFTHIVNHLASLGKIFSNEDFINKVPFKQGMTTEGNCNCRIKRSRQHVSCNSFWEASGTQNGTYETKPT